jgi:hypothetical protein
LFDLGQLLAAQLLKADHQIRHLHTGVVDVVLDLNRATQPAQKTHERVAQDGVAQVSDVGGLVRIDVRVLHDHLAATGSRCIGIDTRQRRPQQRSAVEERIEVASSGDFESHDRALGASLGGDGGRDLARRAS